LDEDGRAEHERAGGTLEETAEHWATVMRFVLVRIDAARRLMEMR
jgi:hypothetical protein